MAEYEAGASRAIGNGAGKTTADSIKEVVKRIVADTGAITHEPGRSITEAASRSACAFLTTHTATKTSSGSKIETIQTVQTLNT